MSAEYWFGVVSAGYVVATVRLHLATKKIRELEKIVAGSLPQSIEREPK